MHLTVRRCVLCATVSLAALAAAPAWAQQSSVSEVVVTASPIAGDPDRFATIVDRVGRDDVLANGGASLADALRLTPGVAGTGFAAGASRPVIRGMDSQRVRVVENGLSASDVSDVGPDHGVPLDPLAADCAADGQWSFLYVAAPLKVVNGSGAPVNPMVIK